MTGMRYLLDIITDFGSVKHPTITIMIVYAALKSTMTHFDDGDHEIHHFHDLVPLVSHQRGGLKMA